MASGRRRAGWPGAPGRARRAGRRGVECAAWWGPLRVGASALDAVVLRRRGRRLRGQAEDVVVAVVAADQDAGGLGRRRAPERFELGAQLVVLLAQREDLA